MIFDSIPTEQTTAITDLLMGMLAIGLAYFILNFRPVKDRIKTYIWASAFAFIAVASILGVITHGLILSNILELWLWKFLNMALGLAVGLFLIGVVYDFRKHYSLVFVLAVLCSSVIFCIVSELNNSFFIFILYEGASLIFAFFTYSYLALSGKIKGGWLMAIGILTCIIAAIIQAMGPFEIKIIWSFNHNGIFHIVQSLGLLIIYLGLRADLFSEKNNS